MAHFRKYHGLGNDYLVIDPRDFPFTPTPEAVRVVCERNRGIGSDGILLGPLPEPGPTLHIYNPDGSLAEKSGNGTRIFAWYLYERGYRTVREFSMLTDGGPVKAWIVDPETRMIRMDMGAPSFDATRFAAGAGAPEVLDRPLAIGAETCRVAFVSMGNPHCVVLDHGASEATARRLGPLVENHPVFPERTNVQFMEVLGPSEIRIEIWERGAGYTLASGTSSCAAAAVARRLGLAGDQVTVRMPGGSLDVRFEAGTARITGPVEKVFEGDFSEAMMAKIRSAQG
jgi:diaminopimelate epimerase